MNCHSHHLHPMNSLLGHLLLFCATLLCFLCSPTPTSASTELIKNVCKHSISYSECLQALESNKGTRSASNIQDLAHIALRLALANAKDSHVFIQKLLRKSSGRHLKECVFWYQKTISEFKVALNELKKNTNTRENIVEASYAVLMAGDDAGFCEKALSSHGVKVPSISARNRAIKLYVSIGDIITSQLSSTKKAN